MPNLTLGAVVPSLIRTYVPVGVGALLSLLVTTGIIPTPLPEDQEAALVTAIVAVTIGLYYTALRFLEQKWPGFGALLGSTNQPVAYGKPGAHRDDDGDGIADGRGGFQTGQGTPGA